MAKFYFCKPCGNLVYLMNNGGGKLVCCGQPMELLDAGVTDAAQEKHVPAVTRDGNKLTVVVGSVAHPMEEKHYITWIAVEQGNALYVKHLKPGEEPKAEFLVEDGPVTVYEFCNLHGLWKADA